MMYIYEKRNVRGYQKWYSHASKAQIQKYKYTKTQIHKYSKWWIARKTQHDMYLWKEDCARISKIVFPCVKSANTKIQRHKYTNTQIQHMMNNQKKIQNSMLGGGTKNIMPSRKYILRTWLILPRPLPPPCYRHGDLDASIAIRSLSSNHSPARTVEVNLLMNQTWEYTCFQTIARVPYFVMW